MVSIKRIWELTRFFYHQRAVGFSVGDDPWFDEASSANFRRLLAKARSYVEYGAGGSTVLADRTPNNRCVMAAVPGAWANKAPTSLPSSARSPVGVSV